MECKNRGSKKYSLRVKKKKKNSVLKLISFRSIVDYLVYSLIQYSNSIPTARYLV